MIPFCCPVCGILDGNGIDGHATNRCKGSMIQLNPAPDASPPSSPSNSVIFQVTNGPATLESRTLTEDLSTPKPSGGPAAAANRCKGISPAKAPAEVTESATDSGQWESRLAAPGPMGKILNRRSRKKYNIYMRDYMRKRRARNV